MANELTVINGVTKKEKDGTFYYFFPENVVQVYPIGIGADGGNYYRLELENGQEVEEVHWDDITDKLGATTIEGYMDAAAGAGMFFNNVNVLVSGGGGGGDATAANQVITHGKLDSIITNTGAGATEATTGLIKTNTDNLDVLLSTRASESTLASIKASNDTIATNTGAGATEATSSGIKANTDNIDVLLSTRATESTLGLVKSKTDNLDIPLSTLETTLNAIETNTAASGDAIRGNTAVVTSVASTATSTTLKAANAGRISITIVNDTDKNLYVKFGATASTSSFTYILPKKSADTRGTLTVTSYTGQIDGIWDTVGTGNALITEVTQV